MYRLLIYRSSMQRTAHQGHFLAVPQCSSRCRDGNTTTASYRNAAAMNYEHNFTLYLSQTLHMGSLWCWHKLIHPNTRSIKILYYTGKKLLESFKESWFYFTKSMPLICSLRDNKYLSNNQILCIFQCLHTSYYEQQW